MCHLHDDNEKTVQAIVHWSIWIAVCATVLAVTVWGIYSTVRNH